MCKISDSAALEENLKKSELFSLKQINIDGKSVTVYEPFCTQKLFLLFAVMIYAKEYAYYKDSYLTYFGDSNFCSGD